MGGCWVWVGVVAKSLHAPRYYSRSQINACSTLLQREQIVDTEMHDGRHPPILLLIMTDNTPLRYMTDDTPLSSCPSIT